LNGTISVADGLVDDVERVTAELTELGAACRQAAPDLLDHVGTVASARDLDQIRQAIGDPHLSYLGFSYGTRLGAVYATLFPETVRAMVLDGAFPPSLSSEALARNGGDLEAVLDRIDRACAREADCRVRDAGVVVTIDRLLDELDRAAEPDQLGLSDRTLLLGATLLAIYVPDAWPIYTDALADAAGGDLSLLRRLADAWFTTDGEFNDIYAGANVAIMCADGAYPTDLGSAVRDAIVAASSVDLLVDVTVGATCEGWPAAGESLPAVDTVGAPPLLVVGSTFDPATPLRWAERLAAELDRAVLVTYQGDGHTIVAQGDPCVDAIAVAYLLTVALPPADTVCPGPTGPWTPDG
jgi:pimeloyl-ACP methyl ester carboxylesterase